MDYDEYTTDEGKRKKSANDTSEGFVRSKKLYRTPTKSREAEDKMDKILLMLGNLTQEIKELRLEQKEYREEMKILQKENDELKKENVEIKEKIEHLENKMEKMERDSRRNNVVIQGIPVSTEDQNKIKEKVDELLENTLNIKIDVQGVRKINEKMCLVELKNSADKEKIMKNKNKLKQIREHKIYINDDMSKTDRYIQGEIRKQAREEKNKGNKVKVGYQKLVVNDEVFVWNKIEKKLSTLGTSKNKKN